MMSEDKGGKFFFPINSGLRAQLTSVVLTEVCVCLMVLFSDFVVTEMKQYNVGGGLKM